MTTSVLLRRSAMTTSAAIMAFFGFTSMVSAQTITNTGPGSTNNITTNVTDNCKVTNTNKVNVKNVNEQEATTGDANVGGSTGLPWVGWAALSPEAAQEQGKDYPTWWGNVLDWVSSRADGAGWDNANKGAWAPASGQWGAWDPVAWQQNGQSFSDWLGGVQGYMNQNSPTWLMTWPQAVVAPDVPDAQTGGNTTAGDATSGNATNINNASFSISIANLAPVDSCGKPAIVPVTPVVPGGGSGGGSTWVAGASYAKPKSGGSYGGGYGGYSSYVAPKYSAPKPAYVAPAAVTPAPAPTPVTPVTPVPPTPPAPANTISNTGPGSNNNITSNYTDNTRVTNTNVVTSVNMNQQMASSGSANVSDNTTAGSAGSGDAGNGNGTGGTVVITN